MLGQQGEWRLLLRQTALRLGIGGVYGGQDRYRPTALLRDPLGIEHLTGSLSATIAHVGQHDWQAPVGLRFTTKYDNVGPLLEVPHGGRTRVRVSVNAEEIAGRFEGGTARLPRRIEALRRLASGDADTLAAALTGLQPGHDWAAILAPGRHTGQS